MQRNDNFLRYTLVAIWQNSILHRNSVNAHFGPLNLFTSEKGLNKVNRRLSTLRTWMLTFSFTIFKLCLFVNKS